MFFKIENIYTNYLDTDIEQDNLRMKTNLHKLCNVMSPYKIYFSTFIYQDFKLQARKKNLH